MPNVITANYDQQWLFPPSLEELLPAEHPARFIRDLVRALDLDALGLATPPPGAGRPAYAPALLLGVWLYGIFLKLYSSRALEAACYDHLGLIWLTGGAHPDHNTLWRFWHANRTALQALFKASVRVAADCGLVGLVLHAVDGTKLPAACSRRTSWRAATLERALARWDAQVDRLDAALAAAEAADDPAAGYGLPAALQEATARREAIAEALDLLQAAHRTEVHPTEPDAQRMVDGQGTTTLAYNAQAAVDAAHGILVAAAVVTAPADSHALPDVLAGVAETLGTTAETTVADGGYFSGETLAAAEAAGQTVLVNDRSRGDQTAPYAKAQFRYDPEQDVYVCPHGAVLPFQREKRHAERGYMVRIYQCRCRDCPHRSACTQNKTGRTIERTPYDDAGQRHAARAAQAENRARLRQRPQLIERVFAEIKQTLGFRRFTWRGLAGVQAQWALVCTVFNLRKLYRAWQAGTVAWT